MTTRIDPGRPSQPQHSACCMDAAAPLPCGTLGVGDGRPVLFLRWSGCHGARGRERFYELGAIERLPAWEQTLSPERSHIDTGDDDPSPRITPLPTTI